ncbi:MAG: NAD(P)H-hydrate epimerase [Candidatus Omnitrophica bacterium CG07_land_8_20_14_0_80_50_8]|nr:MAG: NAD(P)H-hydrate epimerase [Candidatus Omnitrophica bacterium CG07_land_8_20_14_0_80_50_8]
MNHHFKAMSAKELKALDVEATRRFGIPTLLLMENAGIACEEEILRHYPKAHHFLVLCGRGNNGGDGFVLARRLWNRGKTVTVFHFGAINSASSDALLNFSIVRKLGIPCFDLHKDINYQRLITMFKKTDIVMDAIFGIGLTREVNEPFRSVIQAVNSSGKTVVSIDVPSGIHADTGRILGEAIKANICVTFVRSKLGFQRAKPHTGCVIVRDISVPYCPGNSEEINP